MSGITTRQGSMMPNGPFTRMPLAIPNPTMKIHRPRLPESDSCGLPTNDWSAQSLRPAHVVKVTKNASVRSGRACRAMAT